MTNNTCKIELACTQTSSKTQYKYESLTKKDTVVHILGYRRCSDFDLNNLPGQDFATLRGDDTYVVGIVADGVSQSFYGNLASEWVSSFLLKTLWDKREKGLTKAELEQKLRDFEKEKNTSVKNFSIPTNLSTSIQKALTTKQQKYGSQTVFAAFILNMKTRTAYLYQVGDIISLVHYSTGKCQQIYSSPDGRWSSEGKSDFKLQFTEHKDINGIIIKSDGASENWGKSLKLEDLCKEQFERLANKHYEKDDVSFVASIFCTKEDISLLDTPVVSSETSVDNINNTPDLSETAPPIAPPPITDYNERNIGVVIGRKNLKPNTTNTNQNFDNKETSSSNVLYEVLYEALCFFWQYVIFCLAVIFIFVGVISNIHFLIIFGAISILLLFAYIILSFIIRTLYKIFSSVLGYFVNLLIGTNIEKKETEKESGEKR